MKIFTSIVLLFFISIATAQEKGVVQGTVIDREMNQEPLAFATICIKDSKTNSNTDLYGDFYIDLEPGIYTLVFNFAGYQKTEVPNVTVKAGEVTKLEDVLMGAFQVPKFRREATKSIAQKETTTSAYNN